MSWHFLLGQAEASWEDYSLDGAPSALLKLIPTLGTCSSLDNETGTYQSSPSGTTFGRLTDDHGTGTSMSSVAASPAPTSAPQAREPESTEKKAGSGWKWPVSFAKFDPRSHSWKIRQLSLQGDSGEFSETWPKWGSMRNGECSERVFWGSLIDYPESGLLPTPSGVNAGRNHTMGRVDEWGGSSNPLRGTVIGSLCLPEFEELVMGWPVTWTALTPLGMDRYLLWQQMHSAFYLADTAPGAREMKAGGK